MTLGRFFIFVTVLTAGLAAEAKSASYGGGASSGGGLSAISGYGAVGLYGGVVNASQGDLNTIHDRANINQGGITTSALNQAYEISAFYQYRITGTMFALHLRPSYFYERQDGSGSAGAYTYGVTGYTIFPMLRVYPLENEFMKFYMQFGMGYGSASGMVTEGAGNDVKFSGDGFGTNVGMGAEFCLTSSSCIAFEGDYRYLNFARNLVTSSNGTFNTAKGSLSAYTQGHELELDGSDVSIKMGGLMFMAGYVYYF